jgi:hypothetical protein
MKNSIPSLFSNPATIGSLVGTFEFVLNKIVQTLGGMLPAQVIASSRTSAGHFVQIQPLITLLKTDGSTLSQSQIPRVPVYTLGGAGIFLSCDLVPGDLGWMKANDRDISLFLQSYKEAKPNTLRIKSFSDAVFFPDIMTGYTISPSDTGALIISNLTGTVKISVSQTGVTILSPLMTLTGNLLVNGNIGATGTITPGV